MAVYPDVPKRRKYLDKVQGPSISACKCVLCGLCFSLCGDSDGSALPNLLLQGKMKRVVEISDARGVVQ